jgi:hypothetical protein
MSQPRLDPSEASVGIGVAPSTLKQYQHFWVRYFLRENGNLVYQFYSEDPTVMEANLVERGEHKHIPFHADFKEKLLELFKARIPYDDKRDIAYLHEYNSYSVIARGYATNLSVDYFLEPLFEDLDRKFA